MSISPVDAAVIQDPSPVVGKAAPIKDPVVSAGPVTPAHTDRPISDKEVSKTVDKLNASVLGNSGLNFSAEFSKDKESGLTVVSITDKETKEVVQQLPSKDALALAHSIDATLRGNLINQKA